ncbi:hypothetical protein L1987_20384 [Smallanthus sonchifolius]|uniref:Uncharacterized protein n=1 Tax=Smallanthus sonchifolius TaxID=185202 RepID=A0ACB9IUL3_9ASTR|nr:hypothetical protein L1987_20384 [Smallanthus sonchifolius]
MVVDLGLSFGENGVALETVTQGEESAAGASSPLGAQPPQGVPPPDTSNSVKNQEQEQKKPMDATGTIPSELLSIPICLMNTNMEIPVSPVRVQVIHEEISVPISGFQSQQNIDNSPSSPMPIPKAWNDRGAIPPNKGVTKSAGVIPGTQPNTSSDPKIQRKMGDLHNRYVSIQKPKRNVLTDVTNNRGPHVVPVSNPFVALDTEMSDLDKGNNADFNDCVMNDAGFFELNVESIKNVLKGNPASLTVPRVHDLSHSEEDSPSDEDIFDFDITNAQKLAISRSLEKFGSVKASDQANWSPGEWEYFYHLVESLEIDPNTCVEDVDSDSNGSAVFLKSLSKEGSSGGVVVPGPGSNSNV